MPDKYIEELTESTTGGEGWMSIWDPTLTQAEKRISQSSLRQIISPKEYNPGISYKGNGMLATRGYMIHMCMADTTGNFDKSKWLTVGMVGFPKQISTVGGLGIKVRIPAKFRVVAYGDITIDASCELEIDANAELVVINGQVINNGTFTNNGSYQQVTIAEATTAIGTITGDDVTSNFLVEHGLGGEVQVQVREDFGSFRYVTAEVRYEDNDNVRVIFGSARATGENYKVLFTKIV